MPKAGVGGEAGTQAKPRARLKMWVDDWRDIQRQLKAMREWMDMSPLERSKNNVGPAPLEPGEFDRLREQARDIRIDIMDLLDEKPQLAELAGELGFTYKGFDQGDYGDKPGPNDVIEGGNAPGPPGTNPGRDGGDGGATSSGGSSGGGGGGQGGGGGSGTGKHGPNWKLPGIKGKDFDIVRGPKGSYVAVYKMKVGGNVVSVGVRLPKNKEELAKYGVKPGEGKLLTKEQLKKIHSLGYADELDFHGEDRNPFQALKRSLKRQYGGQPILDDDEVMGLIIANSIYGWTPGEFENQLRNTKWYSKTNEYQRDWALVTSKKQRTDTIKQFQERVVNQLEDHFGLNWSQHVKGGMKQAREWAEKIASGRWGEPGTGFEFWSNRMFDRASKIENTPAWIQNQSAQEEQRGFINRPEEMFEKLRSEAMRYLGQRDGKPLIDGDTLRGWATDLVTQKKSESDWSDFLRQSLKRMHPYFDENVAFADQASAYKSVAENLMGTTLDWDHPLLQRGFNATDAQGNKVRDEAMSLHDYEMLLRDPDANPDAYKRGTKIWDEGNRFAAELESMMLGIR